MERPKKGVRTKKSLIQRLRNRAIGAFLRLACQLVFEWVMVWERRGE